MVQQPYIFNPLLQSLPQFQLDPFDGDPLKWGVWSSRFQFMIGNTQMTNDQKIAYLQGLTKNRAMETIEGFKCNSDLFPRAMEELRLRFGQPTLIVNSFIEKPISYAPPVPSRRERYSSFSSFLNAMVHTFKEHRLLQTLILQQIWNTQPTNCLVAMLSNGIKFSSIEKLNPTLETFNSWLKPIAEAMECVPHLSTMPHQENITATFSEARYAPQVSTIRSNSYSNYGNFNSQWKSQSTQRCTSPQKIVTTNSQLPSRNSSSFCPLYDGKHPLFQCTLLKQITAGTLHRCTKVKLLFQMLKFQPQSNARSFATLVQVSQLEWTA